MGAAAPVVTAVVAVAASIVAGPEVGAAIIEYMGVEEASAATVAAVGSAAISGGTSAINSAINGGNVEDVLKAGAEGAAAGAAGSYIGGEVASAVTEAAGGPVAVPSNVGPTLGPDVGAKAAGAGAGGFTQGFTRAELGGSNLQQALRSGEIGGITGAASSLLFPTDATSSSADKAAASVGRTFLGQQVAQMLAPTLTTPSTGGTRTTAGTGGTTARGAVSGPGGYGDVTTGSGGYSPGSQALSQVLNLGSPTSAYSDTGAGGEKVSGETGGKPQNVWNLASLRVKDETGGEV